MKRLEPCLLPILLLATAAVGYLAISVCNADGKPDTMAQHNTGSSHNLQIANGYAYDAVAYADTRAAILATEEGKRHVAALTAERAAKQKEITAAMGEIDKLKIAAGTKKDADRTAAQADIDKRLGQVQADVAAGERDLQARDKQASEQLIVRMRTIIQQVADAEHLDLIVEAGGVVWVAPRVDLTSELVRRYNAAYERPTARNGGAK